MWLYVSQKQTVELVHFRDYKFSAYLHRLIVSCFHSIGKQILNSFHYTKNCKCCFIRVWKTARNHWFRERRYSFPRKGGLTEWNGQLSGGCVDKKGLVAKCHLIRPPSKASKCHSLWYHRYERYPQNVRDKIGHGLHLKSFTLILAKINWQSCDVWFGPPLLCFWSSIKTFV